MLRLYVEECGCTKEFGCTEEFGRKKESWQSGPGGF